MMLYMTNLSDKENFAANDSFKMQSLSKISFKCNTITIYTILSTILPEKTLKSSEYFMKISTAKEIKIFNNDYFRTASYTSE